MTAEIIPKAAPAEHQATWELRLYVAGQTPVSLRAIENLQRICEQELYGDCRSEIIDLLMEPELAKGDEIVVTPTLLVRMLHHPIRRIIGDLSNTDEVLVGLQVSPRR